jgi:hypothetical protein
MRKLSLSERERTRRRYRPRVVRILLIGEAPPASGRFFYNEDSGLYHAIRETFVRTFPESSEERFLEDFCSRGCYLVDLCGRAVDHLDQHDRLVARLRGEPRLAREIADLSPELVVTVVKSIVPNVARAIESARWHGELLSLPYPGRWYRYRKIFQDQLAEMFREKLVLISHVT